MHTGDAGYFKPSGQLVVIDRMRDLATTDAGERFSPQFVENKLKFSPYISEAVVLGDKRPCLSAILCIRFAIVSKWAEQQRMSFTTYSDFSGRPEVLKLISTEIEKVNASLPPFQKFRQFVLLYKELDADDGELTRTRKVRRRSSARSTATSSTPFTRMPTASRSTPRSPFRTARQRIRTTIPIAELGAPEALRRSA